MQKWGREIQTVNKMVKLGFKDVKKTFPQSTQDRKSSGKIKDTTPIEFITEDQRCDTSLIISLFIGQLPEISEKLCLKD